MENLLLPCIWTSEFKKKQLPKKRTKVALTKYSKQISRPSMIIQHNAQSLRSLQKFHPLFTTSYCQLKSSEKGTYWATYIFMSRISRKTFGTSLFTGGDEFTFPKCVWRLSSSIVGSATQTTLDRFKLSISLCMWMRLWCFRIYLSTVYLYSILYLNSQCIYRY